MFVCDASTTLEWFIPGQLTITGQRAAKLARQSPIAVPALWVLETHSAVLRLIRHQVLTPDKGQEIRVELALLSKRIDAPLDQIAIDRTWEIASANMMTFYDASYVELAGRLGLHLASSDSAICAAAKRMGIPLI